MKISNGFLTCRCYKLITRLKTLRNHYKDIKEKREGGKQILF